MTAPDKFHWAKRVARRDIQRLYESDARGMLDQELLDQVHHTIRTRIQDMFEVREAQQYGKVKCRSCGAAIPQPFWMGSGNKPTPLICEQCGWETTCGEFYESYTGKDLLPGSRADLFQEFLDRSGAVNTPQEKMLLLDWLIHEFHVHQGISGRLVAMNVIQGDRQQLVELLSNLASSDDGAAMKQAWLAENDNPISQFRRKYSHARTREIAAELGIQGRSKMTEEELVAEILRIEPSLLEEI